MNNENLETISLRNNTSSFEEDSSCPNDVMTYLNEMGRIPLLSAEEEQELTKKIAQGDNEARKKLVEANLRFVVKIAKRYQNRGIEFLDLIEAGNEGLIKATYKFNPELGYRFSTLAFWWIRESIEMYINCNNRTVRIPGVYQRNMINYLHKVRLLEDKLHHTPTINEIMKYTNYTLEEIRDFNLYREDNLSLNETLNSDEDISLEECIPAEENTEEIILDKVYQQTLHKILINVLNEQELLVIIYHMGFENRRRRTLEELGEYFHVTRERIRQIEIKAISRIRNSSDFKHLYQDNGVISLTPNYSKYTILKMLKLKKNSNIKKAIRTLSEKERQLLAKRYNEDLTKVISNDITLPEFCYIYEGILPKLQKYFKEEEVPENNPYLDNLVSLWGIDILDELYPLLTKEQLQDVIKEDKLDRNVKILIHKYLASKFSNYRFKDFFKDTPKTILVMIINSLSLKEQNVLSNTWGDNYLDSEEMGNVNEHNVDRVIKVLIKIKELTKHKINFWDFFISKDKSTNFRKIRIDKALGYLSQEEIIVLKKVFGNNYQDLLDVSEDLVTEAYNIIIKIKRGILLYPEFQNMYSLKYIFGEVGEEELDTAIKGLSPKHKDILKYYFGENYTRGIFINDPEIKEVLDIINTNLYLQKSVHIKNFGDIIKSDFTDKLKYILYNLSREEKELLKWGLGDDYIFNPKIHFLYPKDRKKFIELLNKIKRNLEQEELEKASISLIEIEEDENFKKVYKYLSNFFKRDYALIMTLYFKSYKYQEFSFEEIAKLLGITEREVKDKVNEGLKWLKDCQLNCDNLVLRLTLD